MPYVHHTQVQAYTHTNMHTHTAVGCCVRLLVCSTQKVNHWETKKREILVPSSVYFFTCLCRTSLALSVAAGNVQYYSSHLIWIFMDGTFPSPAVKEKHRQQSRLKAQVKVLGRKGGGVWGGGRRVQILMHGQKQASLISTLSEGQEAQSSIPNQWHSPKCLPCRVQGSQISVQNAEWHKSRQTNTWQNLQAYKERKTVSQIDAPTEPDSPIPCDVYNNVWVFFPSVKKKKKGACLWNRMAYAKEHHLRGSYRDQSSGCDGLIK